MDRLIMLIVTTMLFLIMYGYHHKAIRLYKAARRLRRFLLWVAEKEHERILAADVDEMGERLYQERLRAEAARSAPRSSVLTIGS